LNFRILMLGDIIGRPGRHVVRDILLAFIKESMVDMVVANGENASGGAGLLEVSAQDLFKSGIDVITSGNHIWDKKEIYSFIDRYPQIIRPANYPETVAGKGSFVFEHAQSRLKIGVVNILGQVFMPPIDSPFTAVEREIALVRSRGADIVVVDFHAEATAEKEAMGIFLSDKAELVVGTHTHVQTSDAKIIKGKTGYITDLGRCGSFTSVIGFREKESLKVFFTNIPHGFKPAKLNLVIEGVVADIDVENKACNFIQAIRKYL